MSSQKEALEKLFESLDEERAQIVEQQQIAGQFQREWNTRVIEITSYRTGDPSQLGISVQEATNIWLFEKLANLELRLRKIENQKL